MKGSAEIILTDVNSGKKEIIKEKNLVTNVLRDMANINVCGYSPISKLLPLKKALCGLFIIDKNLDENPDKYILPYDCNVIGHAGNGSNTLDPLAGSYNETESEELDNGYKFVWDFATHQANGNIKCLSLTSSLGGSIGFGTKDKYANNRQENWIEFSEYNAFLEIETDKNCIVYENKIYNFSISSDILTIKEYSICMSEVTLNAKLVPILINTHTIKLDDSDYSVFFSYTKRYVYCICCKKIDNKLKCYIYEIDLTTFTINRKINLDTWCATAEAQTSQSYILNWRGIIIDDYVFMFNYNHYTVDNKKIYRITLSNPNDIKLIQQEANRVVGDVFSPYNNRVFYMNGFIENDKQQYYNLNSGGQNTNEIINGIYNDLVYVTTYDFGVKKNRYLVPNVHYLATINNLATPIVKTADKTMKVIYTITNS